MHLHAKMVYKWCIGKMKLLRKRQCNDMMTSPAVVPCRTMAVFAYQQKN